jgi:hypothetical protein
LEKVNIGKYTYMEYNQRIRIFELVILLACLLSVLLAIFVFVFLSQEDIALMSFF